MTEEKDEFETELVKCITFWDSKDERKKHTIYQTKKELGSLLTLYRSLKPKKEDFCNAGWKKEDGLCVNLGCRREAEIPLCKNCREEEYRKEFDLRYCGKCGAMTNHVKVKITKEQVEKIVSAVIKTVEPPTTLQQDYRWNRKMMIEALKSAGLEVEEDG